MIKHVVMFKLKDYVDGMNKTSIALKLKEILEGLKHDIHEIQKIEVGLNESSHEKAYDCILYSEFKSFDALEKYKTHPKHVEAGEFLVKVKQDVAVVDYEA